MSESTENTYDLKRLLQSIHLLPFFQRPRGPTHRVEMDHILKKLVFNILYFSITDNGKYLKDLFQFKIDYLEHQQQGKKGNKKKNKDKNMSLADAISTPSEFEQDAAGNDNDDNGDTEEDNDVRKFELSLPKTMEDIVQDLDHNSDDDEADVFADDYKAPDDYKDRTFPKLTDFYKLSPSILSFATTTSAKNNSHKGRNCGKKFKVGEPLYRCKECGYDDTCVLCINCFNPDEHENHHVYTDICHDFTSGICDCGDAEAWNTTLHCKADQIPNHSDDQMDIDSDSNEDIFRNPELQEKFKHTLSESFDYFIDLFSQNIEPLTTFTKDINLKLRELTQDEKYVARARFMRALAYKNPYIERQHLPTEAEEGEITFSKAIDPKDYAVIIYNDEFHNYSQATMALRQGVPDNIHIDLLTSKVDSEGRAMLKCSDKMSALIEGFFAVQTNGLSATLTSWTEYIHQEVCKYIVMWLNHCLSLPLPNFQNVFRESLGEILCSTYEGASTAVDILPIVQEYFPNKLNENDPYRYVDASLFAPNNKIPLGHHKDLPDSSIDSISSVLNVLTKVESRTYSNTRLQHILYLDNRYWKRLRKDLQNVIIPTLASSIKYKPIFSQQVVEIFNHITRSVAYMDREPQLTALRECVVQLFTCPTNAQMIFRDGNFIDIIWSIIDIFVEFCKVENGTLIWQRVQKSNPSKSYTIAFKQGLYIVETLLSKINDPNIILKPKEFISIVTLCKIFNSAWKIKRKEGEHVLHEDQHFIPYLEYTTTIYSIVQTVEKLLEDSKHSIDQNLLLNAIHLMTTFLGHKSLVYKLVFDSHEIIKFTVSNERVAFMHPVHTLFSFLIEKVPLLESNKIIYQDCTDFLKISDFALRSVVLCSQIDVGFWVRNGMSVLHQASYYKNNPELNSYSRDIHLNQLAFLWETDDMPRVIYNMLDRWELLDWFNGEVEYANTVYRDKISLMIQQFISFNYQVLTERQFFKKFATAEERVLYQIKNAIIYNLYTKPLSYSKLLRLVPDYLIEDTTLFDSALSEVSIFVEPKGLADNGVFKLKESFYSKIDPLKLSNLDNEFESSSVIIKSHLTKNKKDTSGVILQPQIKSAKHLDENAIHLGNFTRTSIFAKIVYKLLQVSLDTEESVYLNELLHLLHGIFKDDELVNGKDSLPKAYISKPICNLLLSISNIKSSIFSEHITKKADYLLETMLKKRPDEISQSLVDCFGETMVNDYKAKKLNQGVNLAESERERKRRMAKKHQAKLMAKFNNQQSKFMKENEANFEKESSTDVDMMAGEKVLEAEDFTCSLCQDDTSLDLFIIPAYHDHTPIFRPGNVFDANEFAKKWDGFHNDDKNLTYIDDKNLENLRTNGLRGSRKVFVSCNHHIHNNCFKRYIQKKRFVNNAFICPLCQTFSNCIIPVYRSSKASTHITLEDLVTKESSASILSTLFDVSASDIFDKVSQLVDQVVQSHDFFDKRFGKSEHRNDCDVGEILMTHWANTISMLEISSRADVNTNATFLKDREQKYQTLKNVLIFILLVFKSFGSPNFTNDFYKNVNNTVWNQNQVFQVIVRNILYPKTTRSVRDSIGEAVLAYANQIMIDYASSSQSFQNIVEAHNTIKESGEDYTIDGPLLDTIKSICPNIAFYDEDNVEKFCNVLYTSLLRNLLPTLRRGILLIKVFHEILRESDDEAFVINGISVETLLEEKSSSLPDYIDNLLKLTTNYESLNDMLTTGRIGFEYDKLDPYLKRIPYEYCGIIKLVNLSKYLNTYVTNTKEIKLREEHHHRDNKNRNNRLDFKICLTCGVKIHLRSDRHEMPRHLSKRCFKSFGIFLIPNTSEVCLFLSHPPSTVFISAPYLNSHGEVGRNAMKRGDLTTLNLKRYEHLNKLWINNEIPGYISRVMGDEFRVSILSNGFLFTFDREGRQGGRFGRAFGDGFDSSEEEEGGSDASDVERPYHGNDDDEDDEDDSGFDESDEDNDGHNHGHGIGGLGRVEAGEGGGIRMNFNGQPLNAEAGDFFRLFETFRNNLAGEGGEGPGAGGAAAMTAPFLQFLGPQFRGTGGNNDGEDGPNFFNLGNNEGESDEESDNDAW
ncbi:E3 ubiquitin-protein ligase UBR1 NDAI_0D01920 [Naumovozyma dairenensis CBS 421]|uniref:E3 ubiquitin-protein ligase n=1 Tax=Naumovozyma dairenensis (strain ATCC 10597 / BCRC 20456 / CBS 421 / NBRC 0211 / NRRL Y-12639) TaxID=1071378 RepID=G0W9P5_NAUDC|nr:hypothetical protein NDAI_0D01920 [Naumovozyma dairenensis CBS 421]CCD24506.1 hypothetical protein NDAI_0D01920 [Naumovozyma dairenensis CBS 421]